MRQPTRDWKICLGGCEGKFSFIGGIRDFIYINHYHSADTLMRIKHHALNWDSGIRSYFRFKMDNFESDELWY